MKNQDHRFEEIEICDGKAKLTVSHDCMRAVVVPLDDDFIMPSMGELSRLLEPFGVELKLDAKSSWSDDGFVVASGREPVQGEDGRIEILAQNRQDASVALCQEEDVCVDPKEKNYILNVRKGEKIARRVAPGKGVPGYDVFGRVIPALPGNWPDFEPGEGAELLTGGEYIVATRNGGLCVDGPVISVIDEWEINGDVDMSTGHVEFSGRILIVRGDVSSGFKVKTRGDLVIEGNIEDDSTVEVGGKLHVNGLIRSKNTEVKAGSSIHSGAIEYACVRAGKNLVVEDYVLDANCFVGGDVTVMEGKGLVAGGKIVLAGSFVGKILGTPAYVPTLIRAGCNPELRRRYEQCASDIEEYAGKRNKLKGAVEKLRLIKEKQGGLSEKNEKLLQDIKKGISDIFILEEERKREMEALDAQFVHMRRSTVSVLQKAHTNTKIQIYNTSITLKKSVESVQFKFRRGQIVINTL